MHNIRNIIVDVLILIFASIGCLISIGVLFLLYYRRHQHRIDISTLLICNNHLTIIFSCLLYLDMYAYQLYGDIHENVSFDNWWCYGRTYLLSVGLISVYHSYLIQAVFRIFRVCFYKHKQLQKFPFMLKLILIQWLTDFVLVIPALFLNYFEYTSEYYYCTILYSNLRGVMHIGTIEYILPMVVIGLIYFYIVYYIKKRSNTTTQQNRRQANQRDLVVLRRIIVMIGILLIANFPGLTTYSWYAFTGYLYPLGTQFQCLSSALILSFLPIAMAFLTPQLRALLVLNLRQNRRIRPMTTVQQYNGTQPMIIMQLYGRTQTLQ